MNISFKGKWITFVDKTEKEIIDEIVSKVPDASAYRPYIHVNKTNDKESFVTLDEKTPTDVVQKIFLAFVLK